MDNMAFILDDEMLQESSSIYQCYTAPDEDSANETLRSHIWEAQRRARSFQRIRECRAVRSIQRIWKIGKSKLKNSQGVEKPTQPRVTFEYESDCCDDVNECEESCEYVPIAGKSELFKSATTWCAGRCDYCRQGISVDDDAWWCHRCSALLCGTFDSCKNRHCR